MNKINREAVLSTLNSLHEDIRNDITKWDGKVVDGRAIATMFGELSANLDILRNIVELHISGQIED